MVVILAFATACLLTGAAAGLLGIRDLHAARKTLQRVQIERLAALTALTDAQAERQAAQRALSAAREEAARLEHQRAQLAAENERIRARRHTHATAECFEDALAVADDVQREIELARPFIKSNQLFRYIDNRVARIRDILASGRPGPYAYRPQPTHNRPARPGVVVTMGD